MNNEMKSAISTFAEASFELYSQYIQAGFTPEVALQLLIQWQLNAMNPGKTQINTAVSAVLKKYLS